MNELENLKLQLEIAEKLIKNLQTQIVLKDEIIELYEKVNK
jgi:hypothetical protein